MDAIAYPAIDLMESSQRDHVSNPFRSVLIIARPPASRASNMRSPSGCDAQRHGAACGDALHGLEIGWRAQGPAADQGGIVTADMFWNASPNFLDRVVPVVNEYTKTYDVICWFGERGKIFDVHFHNIRGHRDDFFETFLDEDDVDFVKVVRPIARSAMTAY